jgi:pilus assembly protein CpaF
METRPPNVEGIGAVTIRQLVINSLRMRPDRIIVGEVRAEEALDMLQAMNTGHDGSLTTLHANTPRDALGRLEVMVGMANSNMGIRSIRQQISSAVDLFIQTSRFSDGTRRITHITEVVRQDQRALPRHWYSSEILRSPQNIRDYPADTTLPDRSRD